MAFSIVFHVHHLRLALTKFQILGAVAVKTLPNAPPVHLGHTRPQLDHFLGNLLLLFIEVGAEVGRAVETGKQIGQFVGVRRTLRKVRCR